MLASFWMVFWEYKVDFFIFLFLTEWTDIVVDSVDDGVWGSNDEVTCAFSDKAESWY